MKKLRVALIYNAFTDSQPDEKADTGSLHYLRQMIRGIARGLRRLRHDVVVMPLAGDLSVLQRKLDRLRPDIVFNQYDDVVHGALYEMRVAAFIRMLGYPITGSPALGLGLSRDKFMSLSLLKGAGLPIPPSTAIVERLGDIDGHKWTFPLIVHAAQEHAGIGLDRDSVVDTKTALKEKAREILRTYKQPALVQHFLKGREFNVGLLGGRKVQVLPLAEVDYSQLPRKIPPIMSYAAKWVETSVEYQRTDCHLSGPRRSGHVRASSARPRSGPSASSAAGVTAASTSGSTRTASPSSSRSTAIPASTAAWAWPARRRRPGSRTRSSCRASSRPPSKAPRTTGICPSSTRRHRGWRAAAKPARPQPVSRPV